MKVQNVGGYSVTVRGEGLETVFRVVEGPLGGREFRVTAKSGADAVDAFIAWAKGNKT
jgi:hypothetical protein